MSSASTSNQKIAGDIPTSTGSKMSGADVAAVGTQALPYLTTLANMSRKVPNPPKPEYYDNVNLNRVDYSAQKAEADKQRTLQNKAIKTGTTNSATATAAKVGTLASTIEAKNRVSTAEDTTNNQIANQEVQVNNQIQQMNKNLTMAYNQDKFQQKLVQQGRAETGMNQLATTAMMQGAERNAKERDANAMIATMAPYIDSGVLHRNPMLLKSIEQSLKKAGYSKNEISETIEGLKQASMTKEAESIETKKPKKNSISSGYLQSSNPGQYYPSIMNTE